jgi:hypothetical protein
MDSQESSIERETHVSNNDDTCCEIIHNNDELENEQRNDTTLKLILSWKENNLKPSWTEVSKYGTEVKLQRGTYIVLPHRRLRLHRG